MADGQEILARIRELIEEEKQLREERAESEIDTSEERTRL